MHFSVLLKESIDGLNIKSDGVYIDGTFGRGGHSTAILEKLDDNGILIVFDQDLQAIEYANKHFGNDKRIRIVHSNFAEIKNYCQENNLIGKINGILLDLGVSSPQLDQAERGFSFMRDGPLDMRMDRTSGLAVSEHLKTLDREEMARIFREYGEEKYAWKMAGIITDAVLNNYPLDTTLQLAALIEKHAPRKEKKHPATRIFQALRIYVNKELSVLEDVLIDFADVLDINGRLSIISFHSLEDRIVKRFFTIKPKFDNRRGLPVLDEIKPIYRWINKKIKASDEELQKNNRSRSALLRVIAKI